MIPRIGDVLDGALRTAGLEPASVLWQIGEAWPDIVGPRVAARATPRRLRRGELVLAAPDAVWRQELTLLGPEIVANVNRKLGSDVVQRVRLVTGPLHPPAPAPRRRRRLRLPASATSLDPPLPETNPSAAPQNVAEALEALLRSRAERLATDRRAFARSRPRPR